jgi:hypothetical protein
MTPQKSWKTVFIYAGAILLGIVLGQLATGLAANLPLFSRQPSQARALAAPMAALAPGSPEAVYICTPSYIGAFPTRVHVLCTAPAPGGIYYFAAPTSDSKNANRVLSIMMTAKALGKTLQIYYDAAGDGSAFGCQPNDCRPITAIEITN